MAGVVLVVDDDPSLIGSLRESLAEYDVGVEGAADVASACALLDERRFCGLVLDLVLEKESGFDVLRHVDRSGIEISTVVVTQKLPSYVRETLGERHVKLVLPKPVELRLLTTVVLGLCGIAT